MGLITRQYNYVSGQTIRSAEVNTNEITLYNEINGSIEDVNIKSETLTQRVFSDSVNPLVRDAEKYRSYVASGLSVSDASDSLAKVNVSAGTIYTLHNGKLFRQETAGETYSLGEVPQGDYYLFVDYSGNFSHNTSPIPEQGRQVLAKLTVSAQPYSISVIDLRRMRLYDITSHYLHGCMPACVQGSSTSFTVSAGIVEIGSAFYTSTASTDPININTAGNYIGGTAPAVAAWCYIYLTPAGSSNTWTVKLSTTPPAYSDTAGNTDGVKIYLDSAGVQYRCIGAVYRLADGAIRQFVQTGNYVQYNTFVDVAQGEASDANIPDISIRGYFELRAYATNGKYARVKIRPAGTPDGDYYIVGWDSAVAHEMHDAAYVSCRTNEYRQIQVDKIIDNGTASCKTVGFWTDVRQ
ncbi:MAG: hypothetical protein RBU23_12640 [Candidatus Auribacterota bacterium]|jgi:hypothetical protein|nr:hypothetical protein [Candidatus Auribacterota bacterium]